MATTTTTTPEDNTCTGHQQQTTETINNNSNTKTKFSIIARPFNNALSNGVMYFDLVSHVGILIGDDLVYDWDTRGVHVYGLREFAAAESWSDLVDPVEQVEFLHQMELDMPVRLFYCLPIVARTLGNCM